MTRFIPVELLLVPDIPNDNPVPITASSDPLFRFVPTLEHEVPAIAKPPA